MANSERGTRDGEDEGRGTRDEKRGTRNGKRETGNEKRETGNGQNCPAGRAGCLGFQVAKLTVLLLTMIFLPATFVSIRYALSYIKRVDICLPRLTLLTLTSPSFP